MSPLYGNERANAALLSAFNGRPFHAYLVCGPEGSGKTVFAETLAAGLVCTGDGKKPCGVCIPCKKAAAHAHPDIITVYKTGKQKFTVDQSRRLRNDMLVRPNEAEYKVYILPDAHYANDAAQNALLKVLEEPPEYGVIILIAKSAEDMLPTVRSRCVRIDMQPLREDMICGLLKKEYPSESAESITAAAREGGGYLGAARALLSGVAHGQDKRIAAALAGGDELELFRAFAETDSLEYEERREALAGVCGILSEALKVKTGAGMSTGLGAAHALAGRFSEAKLAALLEKALGIYRASEIYLPFGMTGTAAAAALYETAVSKK